MQLDLLIEYVVADTLAALWDKIKGILPGFKSQAQLEHEMYMRPNARSWRRQARARAGSDPGEGGCTAALPGCVVTALRHCCTDWLCCHCTARLCRHCAVPSLHCAGLHGAPSPRSRSQHAGQKHDLPGEGGLAAGFAHRNAKVVERKTLRRLMPTATLVLKSVFKTVKLQVCGAWVKVWERCAGMLPQAGQEVA